MLKHSCINTDCSAARITLDNPLVNLWDNNVISDLNVFLRKLESDNLTKIVVVSSDVPDFFASAIDLNLFGPTTPGGVNNTAVLAQYYDNLDRLQVSPVIWIGEVNGRAWGAADEHLMHMDMRFAGPGAVFGAPEAAVGLIHQGGLQQLVQLIGPALTSEYMLSAAEVSAVEASRAGWVNSAYADAEALRAHVDALATRIALFDIRTLRTTKASIAEQAPTARMLERDRQRFDRLASLPFVARNIEKILTLSGNQSKHWELNNNDNIARNLY